MTYENSQHVERAVQLLIGHNGLNSTDVAADDFLFTHFTVAPHAHKRNAFDVKATLATPNGRLEKTCAVVLDYDLFYLYRGASAQTEAELHQALAESILNLFLLAHLLPSA